VVRACTLVAHGRGAIAEGIAVELNKVERGEMALWDSYDDVTFGIVTNSRGQYSVWPATQPVPHGWTATDFSGPLPTCFAEIDRTAENTLPPPLRSHTGEVMVPAEGAALRGPDRAVPDTSIISLIRARNLPSDQLAARSGTETVTRGELLDTGAAWARVLSDEGCGREVPVALLLPRGLDALTAIVAVLAAGGAYVPLSHADPPERIRSILDDCGAPIVVTTDELAAQLGTFSGCVLTLSDLKERAKDSTALPDTASGDDLAFIFYTSGTTGEPKGVEGAHAQLVNYALWCREAFAHRPEESTFLSASLFFLGSLTTIFTPLLAGWPIVVAPDGATTDALLELSDTVTGGLLKVTPTHIRMVMARGVPKTGLARQLMVGSEPLTFTRELQAWMGADPERVVVNHYGLTETHGCFCHWLTGGEDLGSRVPIGLPIDNVEAYIVDRHGDLVDVGQVGELLVGGPSLGRGYRHRPSLTAQRWIPHRWGTDGARLLRTGDLARMGADGVVTVLGRADRQVKIRGHRVEPAAVEDALTRSAHVTEALVLPQADNGTVTLAAFLLSDKSADIDLASVRDDLAAKFPPQWIPARMAVLTEFPVNANGKVDTRALPVPLPLSHAARAEPDSGRWSRMDRIVAGAFCDVLKIDDIGLSDSFYELGGDSLASVEVAARVGKELGRDVQVPSADAPTVRAYALKIGSSPGEVK
jgi:amino acid adenylation domain-containing protein